MAGARPPHTAVVLDEQAGHPDAVGLLDDVQHDRERDPEEHGVLHRNDERQHEGDDQDDGLQPAGLDDRAHPVGLDRSHSDDDEQRRESGHRDEADDLGEDEDDDGHDTAGEDQREAAAGTARRHEGRRRHRPTDRHSAEDSRHDVADALPDEVARRVGDAPVGVGHARPRPPRPARAR